MSSLLTNTSAMVALQTMRKINTDMGTVQNQISTGKRIATARDNAALWSIATVMKTDVSGFKAISESLSLGSATLNVGRDGAETITGLLDQLKGKVVAAQEDNVDRNKIQADVKQLIEQIDVVVSATQFNGLNLLQGYADISILSSLNRDNDGNVTDDQITFAARDLTTAAGTAGTGGAINPSPPTASGAPIAAGATGTVTLTARDLVAGDSYTVNLGAGPTAFTYVANPKDTLNDVAQGLANLIALDTTTSAGLTIEVTRTSDPTTTSPTLKITNGGAADVALTVASETGATEFTGGLVGLDKFDVSTKEGAAAALGALETYIQRSIGAAAEFGSAQGSVDTADNFIGRMIDSLTEGVGALVDADMESASARLQALQVQQQLGTQSLTIANQQPQNILALFQQ